MNLNDALAEFDATETTLSRLEAAWQQLSDLVPEGIAFVGGSPEDVEHKDLCWAFGDLVDGLPAIDHWTIAESPWSLDEIAQARLDAQDVGEVEAMVSVARGIDAPGEAIREYRFRFNRARRSLVRARVQHLLGDIEAQLAALVKRVARDNEPIGDSDWPLLAESIREVERLMGSSMSRNGRWTDLRRHLSFGQGCDVHDIAEHDWPSVIQDIQSALYGELEPMPVTVEDLADLVATRPTGPVSTKLAWGVLDDEGFERLIYNLINDAPGYENPQWLMRTNAPDRGRDLSVDRVVRDSLSGVTRQRVIIQCKHWLSKSVAPSDVANALTAVTLWEPPPVDVLIVATSGRFTQDAVQWIEKHSHDRLRPAVEPWPETHLESLLAQRPPLVTEFELRPRGDQLD
jgi:hypothetical protein